ncbi:ABC-F family ATP-binding cassette domain-containing protein [Neotabrizicola shimadae]|uniref:ABC-F family ATP-binding cassette domain-containing protein n=1 Tax=Neotabrizicola shimadae TaxID=2807096 RepID=A0A8G1EBR4_9RHOB|nr:ABC-F family ATP-binding cassette domain-containing protein [Neotabrizicola shimadae]QYZ68323.1 ABC-F family ATP-binding cassette domain-containing protein [Neotabrizicola shimadae]
MSVLSLRSVGLVLAEPLFSDLTFSLVPGARLGLVAANGRGKSSLLKLIAGEIEPSSGQITRARGLTVAHVSQDPDPALAGLSLRDAVARGLPADGSMDWRADVVLDELAVPWELRDTTFAALSGGWQRTALLAAAAVGEPDLYLLDEPTNHLDLARIGVLTRWLADLPRDVAVIVASHDRAFLDEATGSTLFLRPVASRSFALPYSRARAALDEADAADARAQANDLARAEQLRRQAAKLKNIGINSGSDLLVVKTKQLTERAEKIEAAARAVHREGSSGAIRLTHSGSHAKALVTLADAAISAPDGRPLYRTGEKWIEPGDRIVLLGGNGAGKTRLVEAVLAACRGEAGAIRAAPSLVLGHADQALTMLPPKGTPFDLVSAFGQGDAATRSLLAGAGIRSDRQGKPLASLSGGQKARLAMLMLRLMRPNFHLLDEPTNHLDIEGQEALESELTAPQATCLVVSHDRGFVRAIANRFWLIEGKRLVEVDSPEPFFAAELARG